jgi:hypothetical protein
MKFNQQHFCSLVSVHEFHQMLFNLDAAFYGRFLQEIKKHTGCGGNVKSVQWLLEELGTMPTKLKTVTDWMLLNVPHVIDGGQPANDISHRLEAAFSGDVHTIPRRKKIPLDQLDTFLATTIKHEVYKLGNIAYVEYLSNADHGFAELVAEDRWLLNSIDK